MWEQVGNYMANAVWCVLASMLIEGFGQHTIARMARLLGIVLFATGIIIPVADLSGHINSVADKIDGVINLADPDSQSGAAKLWRFLWSYPGDGNYSAPGGRVE
jgi:hypothetical protein